MINGVVDLIVQPSPRLTKYQTQLIVALSQHPQNGQEQVQNVQIKINGGPNVLVISEALD